MEVRPIDRLTVYEVRSLDDNSVLVTMQGAEHNWQDAEDVAVERNAYVRTLINGQPTE